MLLTFLFSSSEGKEKRRKITFFNRMLKSVACSLWALQLFVCVCWRCSALSFPACCRWTMWRKAAAFKTPRPCWCQRREPGCSTPQPTASSPTPRPRWTAAPTMRTTKTTTSGWTCALTQLPFQFWIYSPTYKSDEACLHVSEHFLKVTVTWKCLWQQNIWALFIFGRDLKLIPWLDHSRVSFVQQTQLEMEL